MVQGGVVTGQFELVRILVGERNDQVIRGSAQGCKRNVDRLTGGRGSNVQGKKDQVGCRTECMDGGTGRGTV